MRAEGRGGTEEAGQSTLAPQHNAAAARLELQRPARAPERPLRYCHPRRAASSAAVRCTVQRRPRQCAAAARRRVPRQAARRSRPRARLHHHLLLLLLFLRGRAGTRDARRPRAQAQLVLAVLEVAAAQRLGALRLLQHAAQRHARRRQVVDEGLNGGRARGERGHRVSKPGGPGGGGPGGTWARRVGSSHQAGEPEVRHGLGGRHLRPHCKGGAKRRAGEMR